ncbi:UPF0182 family protein [Gemmatimonas sp. UBA7669]|uniref:UPF0182 family protein n=1 Tax=Gemmatimonas sp. UBA7669 TaxID=1946568 RepID=UPI0025C140E0|nr:UPF0182 family protein [Gemmatimonas sp. UBA7669]
MRGRAWLVGLLAAAAALLLAGRTVTALVVDHAWYRAMGVPGLFWEQLTNTLWLQGGAWLVGSLFAFANLHAVRRTILAVAVPSRVANIELTAMVPGRRLFSLTVILSLVVGAVLAWPLDNWEALLMARHGQRFGEIEGIFDRDLGHYLYWLPLEETLYLWALVSVVALTAMVLVLYALTRSLRLEGRRFAASTHVRRHLSVLGSLVLLLLAWSYRLDAFDLLTHGSGPDGMFLRVDHRITLRMDTILSYGAVLAALVVFRAGWVGQLRTAFITLTVVLVSALGLRHVAPAVAARAQPDADARRRDADYVASRALYSRRAFDVDAMQPVANDSSAAVFARLVLPTATLADRVSLWDRASLAAGLGEEPSTASSSVATRAESAGARAASDRGGATGTPAGGNLPLPAAGLAAPAPLPTGSTADVLSARYIDAATISWRMSDGRLHALRVRRPVGASERWPVSLVDVTQPVLRDQVLEWPARADDVQDAAPDELPHETSRGGWPLFGPGLSEPQLLDVAPSPASSGLSDTSAVNAAHPVVGVPLDSWRARIAHAWALRDASLLQPDSLRYRAPLLVTHRDVRERVQRLAPIFVQGQELQPLLHGNRLYWALHLYSASDRYPLSQRWQVGAGVYSYFKLAATALVDAATGQTRLVPVRTPDPVTRTWQTRFPTLFTADSLLPDGLADHLPPASERGLLQIRTLARYGSRLDGAAPRTVPDSALFGGTPAPMALGSGPRPTPGWAVPLLDSGEQVDGMAVVMGGSERATYWWPVSGTKLQWRGLNTALQIGLDSARAALPDGARRDMRLRRGRIVAVPTAAGLLYLQGVQWARGDGSTVVARVAITDGARVGVGSTTAEALSRLGVTVSSSPTAGAAAMDLVPVAGEASAARWYDAMRQAMRRGDWSAFGAAFDSLGRVLGRPPQ